MASRNPRVGGRGTGLRPRRGRLQGVEASFEAVVDPAGAILEIMRADPPAAPAWRRFSIGARLGEATTTLDPGLAAGLKTALAQERSVAGCVISSPDASHVIRYRLGTAHDARVPISLRLTPLSPEDLAALAEDASRRTEALQDVLAAVNRVSTPEDAARAVLPLLLPAFGAECGAVYAVRSGGTADVLAAFGPTRKRGFPYPSLELEDERLIAIMQRPGALALLDGTPAKLPAGIAAICPRRCGLVALAPCFAGHDPTGVLAVCRKSDDPLSIEEAGLLSAAADVIGLALGNSALSEETHVSEVILETACAVAHAISGSLDLNETFRHIAISAAQILGDCRCLLLEVDGDEGDLVAVASSDPADEILLGLRIRFDDAPDNKAALKERRTLLVDDVVWGARTDANYRSKLAMRSALFVPIHADAGLIGSLLLFSAGRRESYSAADVARAETVAEQAASAICNARVYRDLEESQQKTSDLLERLTSLRQRGRQELATAIHDDIVQTIVAALYEMEGLREQALPDTLIDVDRVMDLLRQTIAEARRVIWDLRPPALEGLGLHGAMMALVERLSSQVGPDMALEYGAIPDLAPGTESALYIIARESLQNAQRHAGAKHITTSLILVSANDALPRVRLRIADDGCGFSTIAARPSDHFGLTMMDEQAALAGGTLEVRSSPGRGTTIETTVPALSGAEATVER
jgi:two-component system NarL family sensor kinase